MLKYFVFIKYSLIFEYAVERTGFYNTLKKN